LGLNLNGQSCGWTGNQNIGPNKVDTIPLLIQDHLSNDLQAEDQSLCQISVQFSHKWAGDLELILLSPGGQSITLMAVANPTAGSSLLATWDVRFVPCGKPASPDLDFPPAWLHEENDYVIGGEYRGSYYPSSGCLEDFDTGPVNGTWKLIVSNGNASGILNGFRLEFCNADGLECCFANGGTLPDRLGGTYCEGDSSLFLPEVEPKYTFPEIRPDSGDYIYYLLAISQGQVREVLPEPYDLSQLPAGRYSICGFSLARQDSLQAAADLLSLTSNELDALLARADPPWCGSRSRNAWQVEILPRPAETDLNFRICPGDSVLVEGQILRDSGRYEWVYPGTNGCDSLVVANIQWVKPANAIQKPDTLNCRLRSIFLELEGADSTDWQFFWSGPGDFFPAPTSPSVWVEQGGTYQLELEERASGCRFVQTIEVLQDTITPFVSLDSDGDLDCRQDSVLLEGISEAFSGEPLLTWGKDANSIPNLKGPSYRTGSPGTYWLAVTDSGNGCRDTARAIVERLGERIRSVGGKAKPLSCTADGRFQWEVDSVWGGAPPFQFWLNDTPPDSATGWTDLPAGRYNLKVQGQDGCILDTLFHLDPPLPIQVDLGPDLRTEKGIPLRIIALVTGPWDSLVWEPTGLRPTTVPLEKVFPANETEVIVLRAFSAQGCSGLDSLHIQVVSEQVYLPTAFSPNGDGANDFFYVQAGEDVVSVQQMSIFDRWGNRLYFRESFPPNDPGYGWDGRSGEKSATPGVYVYLIEVTLSDGRQKQFQGEVQLLGAGG